MDHNAAPSYAQHHFFFLSNYNASPSLHDRLI